MIATVWQQWLPLWFWQGALLQVYTCCSRQYSIGYGLVPVLERARIINMEQMA
jgi:hypothetical protein